MAVAIRVAIVGAAMVGLASCGGAPTERISE